MVAILKTLSTRRVWASAGARALALYVMLEWYVLAACRAFAERHARRMMSPQRGAAMLEYAVLAALIVVGTIAATQALGTSIGQIFTRLRNRITSMG